MLTQLIKLTQKGEKKMEDYEEYEKSFEGTYCDGDIKLDHITDVSECRQLRKNFNDPASVAIADVAIALAEGRE